MQAEYWLRKWSEGKIGFHQGQVNKRLQTYWPRLELAPTDPVFVPLCGKSLDMLWLHQQGHPVFGVDISEQAVQAFFTDNRLTCRRHEADGFQILTGTGDAEGLTLWAGDFFALSVEHLAPCRAVYDRAALIAMDQRMRMDYARQLGRVLGTGTRTLLLTITYDETRMEGPPFSVPDEEVRTLYEACFTIQELAHFSGPERLGNLAERGLETLDERVYLLVRKSLENQSSR